MAERTEMSLRARPSAAVLALSVLAALGAATLATVVEPALLVGALLALVLLVLD